MERILVLIYRKGCFQRQRKEKLKEQENQTAEQISNKEKSTAAARAASRPASPKLVKEPPTKKVEKAKVTEKEAIKYKVKTLKNDNFGEAQDDSFSNQRIFLHADPALYTSLLLCLY